MSKLVKRSLSIAGHRTSITLEPEFWAEVKAIAEREGRSLAGLVGELDATRAPGTGGLSSALRVFVLTRLKARVGEAPLGESDIEEGKSSPNGD